MNLFVLLAKSSRILNVQSLSLDPLCGNCLGVTGTTLGELGELTGYDCLLFPTDLGVIGDGVGVTDPSEGE